MSDFATYASGPMDAPAIVFVHGFMGCARDFEAIAAELDRDFRCVRVDLPGHAGLALPAAPQGMAKLARSLRHEVLDPLADAGAKPSVVGYSMGGRLALQTALDWPDALAQAIFVSTSPGIAQPAARQQRRRQDAERAERIIDDFDGFLDHWYRLAIFGQLRAHEGFEAMLARRLQNRPEDLARVIVDLSPGRQPSHWDRLDRLANARWIVGAEDPKYAALGQELASRGHQVVAAQEAAHAVHVERAAWLAAQIRRCLRENSR